MSLRDNELARRQEGRLELRPQPLRVRWNWGDLLSADGHELRCAFTCSVRPVPEPTERRMLQEVLLGARSSLSDDDVSAHFTAPLRAAAARIAEKHPASAWVEGEPKPAMTEALRKEAAAVAFACGLEVLPPFSLDVDSPTWQRQRVRA